MKKTLVGTVVAEKYAIEGVLARGGFSIVYRGVHLAMQRPVALKVMRINKDVDPTWLERFSREARLISQLEHQNTISIYDFGRVQNEYLYIVMELVEGLSLSRRLNKDGSFEPLVVAEIAQQVCASLAEAHRLGILHRDMKPSNIMMVGDSGAETSIRVLDFGIAKVLEPDTDIQATLTQQGVFIGTPRYASPEQLRKEKLDARSDVYGVGMLMWELIAGSPAVPETDFGTAVSYHLGSQPWVLPEEIACPDLLKTILHKAVEKDSTRRYSNCEELAADLEAFLEGRELPSRADRADSSAEESYDDFVDSIFGDAQEVFDGILERSSEASVPVLIMGPSSLDELSGAVRAVVEPPGDAQITQGGFTPDKESETAVSEGEPDAERIPGGQVQNSPPAVASLSGIDLRLVLVMGLVVVGLLTGIIVVLVSGDFVGSSQTNVSLQEGLTFSETQILDELSRAGWKGEAEMVSPHVIRRGQEEVSVALFDRDAVQAKEPQSGDEGIVLGTQVIYVTGRGDTGTDAVYHVIGVLAAMRARAEVAP